MSLLVRIILLTFPFFLHAQDISRANSLWQAANEQKAACSFYQANKNYQAAIAAYQFNLDHQANSQYLNCLISYAQLLEQLDQLEKSLEIYGLALLENEKINGYLDESTAELRYAIAKVHFKAHNYFLAKNYARQSYRILRDLGDQPDSLQLAGYLLTCQAYVQVDFPETTKKYLDPAWELLEKDSLLNTKRMVDFYQVKADLHWMNEEKEEAMKVLEEKKMPLLERYYGLKSEKMAEHLEKLAQRFPKNSRKAKAYLEQALFLQQRLHGFKHLKVLKLLEQLAHVDWQAHRYQTAASRYKSALWAGLPAAKGSFDDKQLFSLLDESPSLSPMHTANQLLSITQLYYLAYKDRPDSSLLEQARQFGQLADHYIRQKAELALWEWEEWRALLRSACTWRLAIWQLEQQVGQALGRLQLQKQYDLALQYPDNGEHFLGLLDAQKHQKLTELKAELHALEWQIREAIATKKPWQGLLPQLKDKRKAWKAFKATIQHSSYAQFYQPKTDIYQGEFSGTTIKDSSLQIIYHCHEDAVFVLVQSKDSSTFYLLDFNGQDYRELVHQFNRTLKDFTAVKRTPQRAFQDFQQQAHQLYVFLIKDILPKDKTNIQSLKIYPDEVLFQLAFEVLITHRETAGSNFAKLPYLIKEYPISYGYTFPGFLPTVGDSFYLKNWMQQVTISDSLAAFAIQQWSLPFSGPMQSPVGWYQGEDSYSAYALSKLDLPGGLWEITHFPYQRSFGHWMPFFKKAVLWDRWEQRDSLGRPWLGAFHDGLQAALPKSIALQQAKLDYLQQAEGLFQHPYYWAGTTIYGDDSPIFIKKAAKQTTEKRYSWWGWIFVALLIISSLLFWWYRRLRRFKK